MRRKINPKLVSIIDERIKALGKLDELNALIAAKDARGVMLLAALSLEGVREKGVNAGEIVELLQDTIGDSERESWCMSYVQSCIAYAELKTGIKSPIAVSEHCLTVYRETPKEFYVKVKPKAGAIVIWRHGNSDRGHTAFTTALPEGSTVRTIEGNTGKGSAGGRVVREGDGIYQNMRSTSGDGDMKVVAYLIPFQ